MQEERKGGRELEEVGPTGLPAFHSPVPSQRWTIRCYLLLLWWNRLLRHVGKFGFCMKAFTMGEWRSNKRKWGNLSPLNQISSPEYSEPGWGTQGEQGLCFLGACVLVGYRQCMCFQKWLNEAVCGDRQSLEVGWWEGVSPKRRHLGWKYISRKESSAWRSGDECSRSSSWESRSE